MSQHNKKNTQDLGLRTVVDNLTLNAGAEIVRYGRRHKNVLSLGQGEGDQPTPDFIIDGARAAMAQGKTFYGPVLGCEDLRQEISNYYSREHNLALPSHRIFVTGSGTTAMHLALTVLLDQGDEVVALTPIWKNLLGAVELAQAKCREVPLDHRPDGRWALDMDRLTEACSHKTKVLLITSPSNPTGWVMSHDEMRTVLEFARTHNIWIVADEVYNRITFDQKRAPSFLDIAAPEDKLFTINSFSKSWAMTGWRLGWMVGPLAVEKAVRDVALYDNMGPPLFTQYGGIEALRHGEDFIDRQRALWRDNRDYLMKRFAAHPRIIAAPPESTFYSFFKIEGEPDCLTLAKRLIDEQRLSLAPGCAFGAVGKGHMRLCFAVSQDRLAEALDRLERALA